MVSQQVKLQKVQIQQLLQLSPKKQSRQAFHL
jgi:hypothetical protein